MPGKGKTMRKAKAEPYRDIDFSHGKRGPVMAPDPGKTKISIRLDNFVLDYFRGIVRESRRWKLSVADQRRIWWRTFNGSRCWRRCARSCARSWQRPTASSLGRQPFAWARRRCSHQRNRNPRAGSLPEQTHATVPGSMR